MPASKFKLGWGDCISGMKGETSSSVDVVVTSPPYNLGVQYGTYKDDKPRDEYFEWCSEWGEQVGRLLKPDGSLFLNVGDSSTDPFFAFDLAKQMGQFFRLQNTIHWIKSISIDRDVGTQSFGHFKPINSARFLNDCHEYVFHFTLDGKTKLDRLAVGVPYADKTNVARWAHTNGKDRRCRGNAWFVPYKTITERAKDRPHPATFPTELAVKCIRLHGKPNCVVMDPFLGIGHSAYAAQECADMVARFIGFEIDEEYVKVASERIGCQYSRVSSPEIYA